MLLNVIGVLMLLFVMMMMRLPCWTDPTSIYIKVRASLIHYYDMKDNLATYKFTGFWFDPLVYIDEWSYTADIAHLKP